MVPENSSHDSTNKIFQILSHGPHNTMKAPGNVMPHIMRQASNKISLEVGSSFKSQKERARERSPVDMCLSISGKRKLRKQRQVASIYHK